MGLPVVPSTNRSLKAVLRESCSCDQAVDVSLKGLISGTGSTGTGNQITTSDFTAVTVNNLGLGGGTHSVAGYLTSWLGVDGSTSYGEGTTNMSISDFPVGRAADTDGYVGQ